MEGEQTVQKGMPRRITFKTSSYSIICERLLIFYHFCKQNCRAYSPQKPKEKSKPLSPRTGIGTTFFAKFLDHSDHLNHWKKEEQD